MAKLSKIHRDYCLKDIAKGMTNAELIEKYKITSSAICYLRKMAAGESPQLLELLERIEEKPGNKKGYLVDRLINGFKKGVDLKELALDFETSVGVIKQFLKLKGLDPGTLSPNKKSGNVINMKNLRAQSSKGKKKAHKSR